MIKGPLLLATAALALCAAPARADLCDQVQDTRTEAETGRDVDFYEQVFTDASYRGTRRWNEIVVECNRKRDTKGGEVSKVTSASGDSADKRTLKAADLETKVIRGHYNFFGTLITQLKYVYVLSKTRGVWTMTIPYKAEINDIVKDRVDFYVGSRTIKNGAVGDVSHTGHAWKLYDASQVQGSGAAIALKSGAQPIAVTLCSNSTFFSGDEKKYDGQGGADAYKRDPENRFISLGRIQFGYKDDDYIREGCRVAQSRDLYWTDPAQGKLVKVKPVDFILDNFVRTAETYWTIPGLFNLKLLLRGRNDAAFPKPLRDLLADDDHLTVRFATKFMPYHYNQMYKSNLVQFNNFSTMTTDETYWHEVGHAFGLDDEYGGEKNDGAPKSNGCDHGDYKSFQPGTYQMCDAGTKEVRTIYHYIAVSRYVTKQSECQTDPDCKAGEYCDTGFVTIGRNQCLAKKDDNEPCAAVGGAHQCKGDHCYLSRCYTPKSVAMGGACYNDDACKEGKCSAVDGLKGTCVCKTDDDCGGGRWCDAGLDFKTNACKAKLDKGEVCGKVGELGVGHRCKSGECKVSGVSTNLKCK